MGDILFKKRKYQEALIYYQESLSRDRSQASINYIIGKIYRTLKSTNEAENSFKQSITLNDKNADYWYMYGVSLQEGEKYSEAVNAFNKAISLRSNHSMSWSLKAQCLRSMGDFESSIQALKEALILDPEDIPTRNSLVMTYYRNNDFELAVNEGRKVLNYKNQKSEKVFLENSQKDFFLKDLKKPFDYKRSKHNVICFSLWGDNPTYTHGAIINATISPHMYPGWTCRFYIDNSVPEKIVKELKRLGSQIIMITDPKLLPLKPLWRFLASDDVDVDRFLCRDADSRLNPQELIAVDEWVKSGKPFHIMRDHIYHMELMLAGMWGGVSRVLPNIQATLLKSNQYQKHRWSDQDFLAEFIWPLIKNNTLIHDSVYQYGPGAKDFSSIARLPGLIHVGGAIKKMRPWGEP